MNTEVLIDKLKSKMPKYNFTMIRSLNHPDNDDLVIVSKSITNSYKASFRFDGKLVWGENYSDLTFEELKEIFDTIISILDGEAGR